MGEVRAECVMRAMDAAVRDSLSPDQEAAIRTAVRQESWGAHPVDIRLSLPFPSGGAYVTLIAGRERRSGPRLQIERERYPVATPANLACLTGLAVLVFLAAAGVAGLIG